MVWWEVGIHYTYKLWESLVRKLVHNNNSRPGKDFSEERAPPLTVYITPPNSNRVIQSLPCRLIGPTPII
jgi:hypothetical protein